MKVRWDSLEIVKGNLQSWMPHDVDTAHEAINVQEPEASTDGPESFSLDVGCDVAETAKGQKRTCHFSVPWRAGRT